LLTVDLPPADNASGTPKGTETSAQPSSTTAENSDNVLLSLSAIEASAQSSPAAAEHPEHEPHFLSPLTLGIQRFEEAKKKYRCVLEKPALVLPEATLSKLRDVERLFQTVDVHHGNFKEFNSEISDLWHCNVLLGNEKEGSKSLSKKITEAVLPAVRNVLIVTKDLQSVSNREKKYLRSGSVF
jgi:hypothetical protein